MGGLRLILGGEGSGKTLFMQNDIYEYANNPSDTGKNLLYIVPEQFTLQTENELVHAFDNTLMRLQVLSFNRLSYHIFSEVGISTQKNVTSIGKCMILRKICMDLDIKCKQGFINELSELITEFYKYRILPDELLIFLEKSGLYRNLAQKVGDICKIYYEYDRYIQNECISVDVSLDLLERVIGESEYIQNVCVWIDGFFSFTPQEMRLLTKIIQLAHKTTISLTYKPNSSNVYFEPVQTFQELTDIGKILNLEIEKVTLGKAFNNPRKFETPYANIYEEVENIACEILRLTRDEGYRYYEIAVSAANLSGYKKIIQGIFKQYNIPIFTDVKRDIITNPLTETVRALPEIAYRNWAYESVFRFLKTRMLHIEKDDLFDFENYCIEFGINGRKWSLPEWTYGRAKYNLEKINDIKAQIKEIVDPFTKGLRKEQTVKDFSVRIYKVLEKINIPPEFSQVWLSINNCFDEMVSVLGGKKVTAKEFSEILGAGIEGIDMGMIPPTRDRVVVGDINRSRLPSVRVLFLAGMTENALAIGDKGLISDNERETLRRLGLNVAHGLNKQVLRQKIYLYTLFAKPSESLYASYPLSTLDGTALYKANIIDETFARKAANNDFIKTKASARKDIGRLIKSRNLTETQLAVLDYYKTEIDDVFDKINTLKSGKSIQENLSKETTDFLYTNEISSSVSRLEKYAQCPFAYFAQYNLEIDERKIYQVDSLDLGNFFHNILEIFSRKLNDTNTPWEHVNDSLIDKLVNDAVEQVKQDDTREIWNTNEHVITRVSRVAKKSIWALIEHIKLGKFDVWALEHEFNTQIDINGGRKLLLRGRIDRVDAVSIDDKIYIKIIDYKTGSKKFSLPNVHNGTQLQLVLYLNVLVKNEDIILSNKKMPGGMFYFYINDPVLDSDKIKEDNLKTADILNEFKMSGLVLDDVIPHMDKGTFKSSNGVVLPLDEFQNLMNCANKKAVEIAENIVSGKIDINPTTCEYCKFKTVCQIDLVYAH
ncbi:ATP-dependent helicase/deoxyribonuclease subunit B [Clostridia bacterium]|nr:ATP-dependent helicase/deoxyribonuclease subunit B [Clostridia bacterium]